MRIFRVLFIALLFFNAYTLFGQADKCTNSTDQYLCDPGFENSAYRNGITLYPLYRSYFGSSWLEVNRCLGGPDQGPPPSDPDRWLQPFYWFINGPDYIEDLPIHDVPDFFSWYVPTRGTSDYFNRHADTATFPWEYILSVDVPKNFIGWQEPAEGDQYNGYAGLWIQVYRFHDEGNSLYKVRHEYLQCRLKDTLIPGRTYRVSFNVNRANWCKEDSIFQGTVLYETYLKKICAYFSEEAETYGGFFYYTSKDGSDVLDISGLPQICRNNQPDQWLKDTANWMTVSDYFTPDTKKAFITIGNFQNYEQMGADSVFGLCRQTLRTNGSHILRPMYYYIDNISIELTNDTCNCCLHDIIIEPTENSDSTQCCYSILLKSDSSTCNYNKVLITEETTNTSFAYSNYPNEYPRNGEEYLITNNFCVPREYDGATLKFKFQFLRQNLDQSIDTLCYKYATAKCNCNCFDLENYYNNSNTLSIYSRRSDDSCCYDIYLLNNTTCQIPLKEITMFYEGVNFNELNAQANFPDWGLLRDNQIKKLSFLPLAEKIIAYATNPLKIATICVINNNVSHPVSFQINLSTADSSECVFDWKDNFKCSVADTNCCDLLHIDLLRSFPDDSIVNLNQVPDGWCCWALKVWQDQNISCPIIKKIEVFDSGNLTLPLHTYNYPNFNNSSGKIFEDMYCVSKPIPEINGIAYNLIHLLVKFTFENDSICIKNIDDTCAVQIGYHGSEKGGDYSIDKENIINLDNITIKPNPFSDKTSIEFTLDKEEFVSLEVYNSIGDRLSTLVSSSLGKGLHKQILDGESYPNGAYYLKFTHGDKSVTIPIVKIK